MSFKALSPRLIPLPPTGTWAWIASYTLLAVASDGNIRVEFDKVVLGEPPANVASRLREIAERLREAPPLTGNDRRKIFPQGILRGLCLGADAKTVRVGDLLKGIADIIEDPQTCPQAFNPVDPVSLVKAEYYEFVRSYGGYSGVKSSGTVKAPPIAQALALAGHVYTRIGFMENTSRHLALAQAERGVSELYNGVHDILTAYLGGQAPRYYTPILQLLAASKIASRAELSNVFLEAMNARDVFVTVTIQGGKRFTVLSLEGLPVAELVLTLNEARELFPPSVFYRAYSSLALAGARARCRIEVPRKAKIKIDEAARKILSHLAEYSQLLVLYAATRQPDLAYAAARVARMAQNSREASLTRVCTTNCLGGDNKCEFTENNSSSAAPEFSILAELASVLADVESGGH